jgi:class 3 adenylate cyclase/tetratricopeptide (TPR) repeat protein
LDELKTWLEQLGLGRYVGVFADNEVDMEALRLLREQDLIDLGLPLGPRRKLLASIAQISNEGVAKSLETSTLQTQPSSVSTAESGERRQLTVMFCDLVGSTALSEKLDPEELRSLLHNYRTVCGEVIARYEGFVARYVGDGILTYFGWPKAHEEDAERALRAALDIVQTVKRASSVESLSVRIGIATGPVVVGEQAGVGEQSKLAIGSTPNLAARLQGLASADQIVVASSTKRLVGNSFELADLGEHELKGIAEPVHAWRVIAVSEAASRFDAATVGSITPMVGREQELGLLLDRWQQAQQGEGQVVLLSGEPGIGKSRLLNALRERLESQGVGIMRFQCSPYQVNSAHYPTIDNWERTLKLVPDESPESKLDKLEAFIVGQYGLPLADVRFVATMLSIDCEVRYGMIAITPQKYQDETLRVLVGIVAAVACRQPTVMLYEDLHWADPTTLESLDLLIDRVSRIPLLIVLTHRPQFLPKWGGHGHVTALNLSKLTRAQSGTIVSKLSDGKELPAGLLDQILDKTDGVPLYVEELTKSILESGELKDAGDRYDYAGNARRITIPATLRDSFMARLDRSAPIKEIAQIGAAIGREFRYELIAALANHTKTDLDSALNQLTESGLAFRRGTPPEATYTFKHALVQDAAYDSMLKTRRQALHAKIAHVLEEHFPAIKNSEPELLAHHLTNAGENERAIGYWQKAGQRAVKRLAYAEAIAYFRRGIELAETIPNSAHVVALELNLQIDLGYAFIPLKGYTAPESLRAFTRAQALCRPAGDEGSLFSALWGLWLFNLVSGELRASAGLAAHCLALAEGTGSSDMRVEAYLAGGISAHFMGLDASARVALEKTIELYDPVVHRDHGFVYGQDPKVLACNWLAPVLWALGYPERALHYCTEAETAAKQVSHPFSQAYADHAAATVHQLRHDPQATQRSAEALIEVAEDQGFPFWVLLGTSHRSLSLIRQGKGGAEEIKQLRDAYAQMLALGAAEPALRIQALLAQACLELGDIPAALETSAEGLRFTRRQEHVEFEALFLRLLGDARLARSKDADGEAERFYRESIDLARREATKSRELQAATSLARLWQSQGKRKEAHDLLAPVYNWFTEGFDTKDLIEAKALLGELEAST